MRSTRSRRRSIAIGAAVSAAYLACTAFAWLQADRRDYREVHVRSMQALSLMRSSGPELFESPDSFPLVFPWQRFILIDRSREVLSDSGWIENESLSSENSGYFLERRLFAFAGLSSPPKTDEARLARLLREAPESGYFGMLDSRTIAAGCPVTRDGKDYGVIVLADKRDLIAAKRIEHEIMLGSFCLILALPAFLLAFAYLRLVRPINRLARAAAALDPSDADSGISLPGESRSDEIGLVSAAFGNALRESRRSRSRIEDFIGDVLHELKNPVSSLRGRIDLARMGSAKARGGGAPTGDELDRLAAEVGRIEGLLSSLSALSAADAQDISGFSRPSELLRDLVAAYEELGKDVELESGLDGGEILPVEPETFGRLVKILVDNALDFGPPRESVVVSASSEDSFVSVRVTDRGPGIPPDRREWIFERFSSTRKEGCSSHAGLGLAIARSLISRIASGGRRASIELADNPGGGATFIMRFPALTEDGRPRPSDQRKIRNSNSAASVEPPRGALNS